jgi:hypothetical protein
VIIIEDWNEVFNSTATTAELQTMLKGWIQQLEPYYEPDGHLRKEVLHVRMRTILCTVYH